MKCCTILVGKETRDSRQKRWISRSLVFGAMAASGVVAGASDATQARISSQGNSRFLPMLMVATNGSDWPINGTSADEVTGMTIAIPGDTMRNSHRHCSSAAVVILGIFAFTGAFGQKTAEAPQALELSGDIAGTHDPSIGFDHGTYYVFATGAAYPPRPAGASALPGAATDPGVARPTAGT